MGRALRELARYVFWIAVFFVGFRLYLDLLIWLRGF